VHVPAQGHTTGGPHGTKTASTYTLFFHQRNHLKLTSCSTYTENLTSLPGFQFTHVARTGRGATRIEAIWCGDPPVVVGGLVREAIVLDQAGFSPSLLQSLSRYEIAASTCQKSKKKKKKKTPYLEAHVSPVTRTDRETYRVPMVKVKMLDYNRHES